MPSLQEIQAGTRTLLVRPYEGFPNFIIEVEERLARDSSVERKVRQEIEEAIKLTDETVDAAWEAIDALNAKKKLENAVPPPVAPKKPAAKKQAIGAASMVKASLESAEEDTPPEEPQDRMANLTEEQRQDMVMLLVQQVGYHNAGRQNERMDYCTAICVRVKDWDLTDGPSKQKKIPLGDPRALYDYTCQDGTVVSTDLLRGILKGMDGADIVPKASN